MTPGKQRFRVCMSLLALCMSGFLVWSILRGKFSGFEILCAVAVLLAIIAMALNAGKNKALNWALMSLIWASAGIAGWIRGHTWEEFSYGLLAVLYAVLALWEWRDQKKLLHTAGQKPLPPVRGDVTGDLTLGCSATTAMLSIVDGRPSFDRCERRRRTVRHSGRSCSRSTRQLSSANPASWQH